MKKNRIFFVLILVFALVSSCHHHRDHDNDNFLSGQWMLVEVTGGIAGGGYTPAFNMLAFSENRYELTFDDEVISDGTYTYDLAVEHGLVFHPEGSSPSPAVGFEEQDKKVRFEGENVLILSDPCCDLFVYRFERKGAGIGD